MRFLSTDFTDLQISIGNFASKEYQKAFGKILTDLMDDSSTNHNLTTWKTQFTDKFTEKLQAQSNPSENPHEILIANGVFVTDNFTIVPEYKLALESVFKGEAKLLNFTKNYEVTKYLNGWISEKTKGMIPKNYEATLDKKTKFILASTIYFNGKWLDDFQIKPNNFYVHGYGKPAISVQMLTTENDFPFHIEPKCNCRVIGIPYQKNTSTLYVFLPYIPEDLKILQKCLTAGVMEDMIEKMEKTKVEVWIPQFKIQQKLKLKDSLKKTGLTSIFQQNKTDISLIYMNSSEAQLTSVNPKYILEVLDQMRSKTSAEKIDPDFYVSEIIQEVHLEVNEKGTKGAAITTVNGIALLKGGGFERFVEKFVADIPFLFLIRHDPTRVPLFYGAVFEPIELD